MSTLTLPFPTADEAKSHRRRLAPRMVLYTLLFSSVVTFFATALQLYLDYSHDVEAIVSRMGQIENSYLQSIELSIWTMDYEQLRAQLEGIRALPDMQYLEIEVNDAAMISVGADQGRDLIRQAFPLRHPYRDINVDLGTLHVVASLDAVYRRLYDKILVIFGAQAVKTFLVATFMLLLFQWLVGRHLAQISSSVRRKRLEAPEGAIALHRTHSVDDPPDELDDVVNAFNEMCATLQHSYDRLAQSEERFDLAMRGANDGVWDWDLRDGTVYYSPRWKEMLGYADYQISDDPNEWRERLHPDDRESVLRGLDEHIKGNVGKFESIHRLRHADGSYRWILSRGQTLRDGDNQPYRIVGTHVDITAQKQTEEALANITRQLQDEQDRRLQAERLACVGEISASIAHEIRNPLSSIINSLELLGNEKVTDEERGNVIEIVDDETRRLQRILEEFLNFARLKPAEISPHDADALLRETAEAFALSNEDPDARVQIKLDFRPGLKKVYCDGDQMRQVVWNLMLNAVQAMPDGGTVTVFTAESGDRLKIGLRDTGAGVPAELRDKLTRPFVSGREDGTGLGLSIVQRILVQHGTELHIDTKSGNGTEMAFDLKQV